ncbi:HEAT repeat domain-containing protein [Streptomyces narbonensis]|uniref:HEAT repeat domain-containing protein n=1 Tax=Streptomyces narbonensis TaxID=67333 RepID=UPI0016797769|nr:HEAT repeat domain-containing protein [Streptomyces narbonensis]GGV98566.1 hypothetical protein GCM10010230_22410 [Streptomyces narbonensis]
MFTGIDDVDWASMDHAYGDASDVPELLRGLASADAAEREIALDGMYGAVHHQGDVYDCTVACVPFLFELVATAGLPGRGEIVELLRSIDGDGRNPEEMDFWSDDEDEYAAWADTLARAEADTRARSGELLGVLADPDARLRRAVPGALVQLHGDPEEVLAVLRRRFAVERDGGVLRALAAAVGELGVRHEGFTGAATAALGALLTHGDAPGDPGLRLSALVQLARCSPSGPLPAGAVGTALDAMREAREEEGSEEGSEEGDKEGDKGDGLVTPTLISYLRHLKASQRGSVKAPWATELLGELHRALDDRVAERFSLLEDQLRSPDWGQRRAAIDMGGLLLTGWRGPHEESVRLLGEQLREADHRIVRWSAGELERLYAIGGPAADALAARVASGPEFLPQARWRETSYGATLCALAAQGDARAVPALVDVLRSGDVPEGLGDWIGRMDPTAAAALAPVLLRRLSRISPGKQPRRTEHLLKAAAATGVAEAVEPALRILRAPSDATRPVLRHAVNALAELGEPAREALPELRRLARDGETHLRVDAAAALWSAGDGTEAVLPVLASGLGADHWSGRVDALRLITRMGTEAAGLLPELRRLVASPEENGGWVAGALATALWEAGRDEDESLPELLRAWSAHVDNRPDVADVWARMGSAARSAVPVVREELAAVRRHNNTGGTGRMRYRCADDELLLRHGRALLEACDG